MSEELTFVLTDVESSTALWERYPEQMSTALVAHEQIVSEVVTRNHGKIVRERGEGDSLFAVFDSPGDAVAAAAEFSRALADAALTEGTSLRVRVAVYTGAVEARDGDYYGTTVNRAARTRSLAFGGQILLGERTAAAVADKLPLMTSLVDLGPRPLKDLTVLEHVFELRLEDAAVIPEPLSDADASNLVWMERILAHGFVGRDLERLEASRSWATAIEGSRTLVLIEGEPGIGKTALAAAAASHARSDEGLVLYGRWDEDVLAPFQGFREALGAYARACPRSIVRADLREHAEEIARIFPEVALLLETPPTTMGGETEAERLRLFQAVEAWIEAIASRRPVLLVLDDLHWADRPSLLLLRHLVRAARPAALCILATYRRTDLSDIELGRVLSDLATGDRVRRLALSGLSGSDVLDLIGRALTHSDPRLEDLARDLHADTAGNPLFVREMMRHLADTDALEIGVLARVQLPETVRDVVRWRVRQLSDDAREALAAAAVAGQEFDLLVLASALGIASEKLADSLDAACRAEVIQETGPGLRYAFSHALVRRTLLDDIGRARRVRMHWRIGEALERVLPPASSAELAYHFGAAVTYERADKALEYCRSAGDKAMNELAFEPAIRHYRQALEIQAELRSDRDELRCELLLAIGIAYERVGDSENRDVGYLEAAEIARTQDRADLFARAALGYDGVLPAATEPNALRETLLEEALDRLGSDDSRDRALLLLRLAHSRQLAEPRESRLALADEAIAIARRLGDPGHLSAVLASRVWALDGPDDLEEQLRIGEEVVTAGKRLRDKLMILEGLRCLGDGFLEAARVEDLHSVVDEMQHLAEEIRHWDYLRIARTWRGVFSGMEGRFDETVRIADEVRSVLREMRHPQSELVHVALCYPVHWLRGTLSDGLPLYEALAETMPTRMLWPAVVAWCTAEEGNPDRARAILADTSKEAIIELDQNFMWWATVIGYTVAAARTADSEWAKVLYDLIEPYQDRACSIGSSSFLGLAHYHLATLAVTAEHWTEAENHFERALEGYRRINARPLLALTQQAYAYMLLEHKDAAESERARDMLGDAMRTAEDLGITAIRSRAAEHP